MRAINKIDLVTQLKTLGVSTGDILNVKASLSSIGWVEGGAVTLLEALREAVGPTGTIVTDSFVACYPLPLSEAKRNIVMDDRSPSYAGALANAMIAHPDSVRSKHPIQKFSAIGKLAEELMNEHTPDKGAYDVLKWMSEIGGKNLKIGPDSKVVGVGTTHVAICLLGFQDNSPKLGVLYRKTDGSVDLFERQWPGGGCGRGFNNFIPIYRANGAILFEGKVGSAESKITAMRRTLEIELNELRNEPGLFLCRDAFCEPCRLGFTFSEGSRILVQIGKGVKLVRLLKERGLLGTLKQVREQLSA
jgi:aminoglycoside N3'-acetyltransferase